MAFMIIITICSLLGAAGAVEFPNRIIGEPRVDCGQGELRIEVETSLSSTPPSRIFAKGLSADAGCHFDATRAATFTLSGCNVNRLRQANPRGVTYTLTVIVQMHPLFITKVDRAYHIKCFYMEADKLVTQNIGVSELTTMVHEAGHAMPQCMYALHRDSANGPMVRYANVGDKVWHVWNCPSDVYGMLVHTCFVTDGQGNQILIIDERGCGVDEFVMLTPEYSADLTRVQQQTHVFKFADRINVAFNCQIKLCFTNGGNCQGVTPPNCDGRAAGVIGEQKKVSNLVSTTVGTPASASRPLQSTQAQPLPTTTTDAVTVTVSTTTTTQTSTSTTQSTRSQETPTTTVPATVTISVTDKDIDSDTGAAIVSEQLILTQSRKELLPSATTLAPFPTPGNFTNPWSNDTSSGSEDVEGSGEQGLPTDRVTQLLSGDQSVLLANQRSTTGAPPGGETPRGRRNALRAAAEAFNRRLLKDDVAPIFAADTGTASVFDIDIDSELIVLDRDDDGFASAGAGRPASSLSSLPDAAGGREVAHPSPLLLPQRVCVSTAAFVGLLVLFLASLCITTMGAVLILIRSSARRKSAGLVTPYNRPSAGFTLETLKYY